MHNTSKVPLQLFSWIEVWALSGPLLHLGFSYIQQFCFRLAVVLEIIVLFLLSVSYRWTNFTRVQDRFSEFKVPRSFGRKSTPNHHCSTTMLNISCLFSSVVVPKSYGLFRCDVANLSHCAMFLFKEKRRRGFLVATFQNKPYPFRLLLIEMSQTFTMLTEACREGFPAVSQSIVRSDLVMN